MRATRLWMLGVLVCLPGCAAPPNEGTPMGLALLTLEECVDTPLMRGNLDAALGAMGLASDYDVVDLARLPPDDHRRGYPAPTLLYANRDLFGLAAPSDGASEPTCRTYQGGVPTAAAIEGQLRIRAH